MSTTLRDRFKNILTWTILVAIASAFLLFGLSDSLFMGRGDAATAARVNGENISWREVHRYAEILLKQQDQEIEPQQLIEQVRIFLAKRAVLLNAIKGLGFKVTEEQVAKVLSQIPVFQEGGKFSKEKYLEILARRNETDVQFREEMTKNILLEQLGKGLGMSSFSLDNELSSLVALLEQRRNFGYAIISAKKYYPTIQVTKEDLQAYYDAHKGNFVEPETVTVEYVELSLAELARGIKVTENELESFYNEHKETYSAPERVRVRHILVKDEEKAAELVDKIKKGKSFEALAKEHSIDPGSAKQGGDLGWFIRGQMVPEFEKAAFEMAKPNDLTGPIKTPFGFHILQLIDKKEAETKPFSQVKPLVEAQLKHEKSQALFLEKNELLAQLAAEHADSLAPIVEKLGLPVKETKPFTRQGGTDIASDPNIVKAAFSDEVLKEQKNSQPIKLAEQENNIVLRLKKHTPAIQQTLTAAEPKIKEELLASRALEKVKGIGETLAKRLQEGQAPMELAKEYKLDWISKKQVSRISKELDRTISVLAFQTPHPDASGKPGVKGLSLPNGDYAVVAVTKVIPGDIKKIEEGTLKAYRKNLAELSSQIEYGLYESQILSKAKVQFMQEPK
jgi:peptidyl-prolyl cis-trans isomerase D